jgi:peroxiredoxin
MLYRSRFVTFARRAAMAQPNRPVYRLSVGEEAPDFELPATGDAAGKGGPQKRVKLSDYRGKNVVLAFYPAAFTRV